MPTVRSTNRAGPGRCPLGRVRSSKVDPWLLAAIKAAALVEYNAPDYVAY